MENFSKRTTVIIAVCFALFAVGWNYGWQKVAELSYPPVHCSFHLQNVICEPVSKAS
jgi:hypothetical protein